MAEYRKGSHTVYKGVEKVDNKEIAGTINYFIRLQSFPVAIKMCNTFDDLPEKAKVANNQLTNCQAMGMARLCGRTIVLTADNVSCPYGGAALGFLPAKDGFLDGSVAAIRSFQSLEVESRNARTLCRFEYRKYAAVVYAPLERATFQPDIVVVYGNTAQVMRLVQGYLHDKGGYLSSQASGCFDCADSVVRAMMGGEPQMVLPSVGDRVFGGAQDHEMIFSMPYRKVQEIMEGLKHTHDSGFWRYPIPSFLAYQAQLPPHEAELLDYLKRP